jgi:hypothetical protein
MDYVEIASFEVVHRALVWPWVTIDPTRTRFAFATSERSIATRTFADGRVSEGKTFSMRTARFAARASMRSPGRTSSRTA